MGDIDNVSFPLTVQQIIAAQQQIQQQTPLAWGAFGNALGSWSGGYSGNSFIPPQSSRMLNFFRINEKATIEESRFREGKFTEPLDELRLKIAIWLYN